MNSNLEFPEHFLINMSPVDLCKTSQNLCRFLCSALGQQPSALTIIQLFKCAKLKLFTDLALSGTMQMARRESDMGALIASA
jgi:hypothetical protein